MLNGVFHFFNLVFIKLFKLVKRRIFTTLYHALKYQKPNIILCKSSFLPSLTIFESQKERDPPPAITNQMLKIAPRI